MVGVSVGDLDGALVTGECVGECVGFTVVGAKEGLGEGDFEGCERLGEPVGAKVEGGVGDNDGALVGADRVGVADGT